MSTKIELISDLLMGAAYADNELDGREVKVVNGLLAKIMGLPKITPDIESRTKSFDPKAFDASKAAIALNLKSELEKRQLIEVIAAVTEADGVIDFDENTYIETVAGALGLSKQAISAFTIEILSVEELESVGKSLTS